MGEARVSIKASQVSEQSLGKKEEDDDEDPNEVASYVARKEGYWFNCRCSAMSDKEDQHCTEHNSSVTHA